MTHFRLNLDDRFQTSSNSELSVANNTVPNPSWTARKLDLKIAVYHDPAEVAAEWGQLEDDIGDNRSCSTWCLAWYEAHKREKNVKPFIIVGRDRNDNLEFVLPLEWRRSGPLKVLVAPGAGHTTYYSGLYSNRITEMFMGNQGSEFWELVLTSIGKIDAILIEGFSVDKFGPHHPLALWPQTEAAHSSMRMDISPDWAAQYDKMITAKLKADDRRCAKRLSELGKIEHLVAKTARERHDLLDVLLQQKSAQFAGMNVVDPFDPDEIVAFYRTLIDLDDEQEVSTLHISALTLDGTPLAANFGLLDGSECYGLITSMTDADLRRFSPGRLLLGHTNEYFSSINIKGHDFGMGMLPYKSVWCQRELKRQHAQISFSLLGKLYLLQKHSIQLLKSWLKSHDKVKRFLNKVLHFRARLAAG